MILSNYRLGRSCSGMLRTPISKIFMLLFLVSLLAFGAQAQKKKKRGKEQGSSTPVVIADADALTDEQLSSMARKEWERTIRFNGFFIQKVDYMRFYTYEDQMEAVIDINVIALDATYDTDQKRLIGTSYYLDGDTLYKVVGPYKYGVVDGYEFFETIIEESLGYTIGIDNEATETDDFPIITYRVKPAQTENE